MVDYSVDDTKCPACNEKDGWEFKRREDISSSYEDPYFVKRYECNSCSNIMTLEELREEYLANNL